MGVHLGDIQEMCTASRDHLDDIQEMGRASGNHLGDIQEMCRAYGGHLDDIGEMCGAYGSHVNDIQEIIDASTSENEVIWIGPEHPNAFGSGMRFDGYQYFNQHPEQLLDFMSRQFS